MKTLKIITLLLCAPTFLFAQIGIDLMTYNVKSLPSYTLDSDWKEKGYEEYGILNNYAIQYFFTEDNVEEWYLSHCASVLLSEKYIKEGLDKLLFAKDILVKLKIRHHRNGEILHEYDADDFEDYTDEDGTTYDCIYPKDLQVMDIFEIMFIVKRDISENHTFHFQESYPTENINYTIITPTALKFDSKIYNGEGIVQDSIIENKKLRYHTIHFDKLPAYPEEDMSLEKYSVRVEDMLAYNYSSSRTRVNGIQRFASNLYNSLHSVPKQALKFMKSQHALAGINKKMSTREIVTTWEHYMKDNREKFIGHNIFLQTANTLETFSIPYQLIITCDQTEREFDSKFDGVNFVDDILIYIPEIDYYLSPSLVNYRNGLIPTIYAGSNALKLEKLTIGKSETYIAKPTTIPSLERRLSTDTLIIDASIDLTKKAIQGSVYRSLFGYKGFGTQANYHKGSLEYKEFLVEAYLGLGDENTLVSDDQFLNCTPADIALKPAILTGKISSTNWVKFDNNQIEIKIGKLIGEQSKLEQKGERQLPVDKMEKSSYHRVITLEIPEEFQIIDAEKLNIKIYDDNDNPQAIFTSEYKISNNKLIITCDEYYLKLHYPVSEFKNIERVNNAAADFNDITITLKKKE